MVIAGLRGGMGNQLFQYAAARRIAAVNNDIVKLDNFYYDKNLPCHLNHFNISKNFITSKDKTYIRKQKLLDVVHLNFLSKNKLSFCIEKRLEPFKLKVLDCKGNVWMGGFWQSEKYFKDIEEIIRREYSIIIPPDNYNQKMIKLINEVNAISIHIRRTDYIYPGSIFNICSLDYYKEAIEEIGRKVPEPYFFIFSDDIQWAKDNLAIEHSHVFIDHNAQEKDNEDLRIMS